MSSRNDLIDAFVAAVQGLSTGVAAANVVEYEGEEALFNPEVDHPLIHVLYGGCDVEGPREISAGVQTYQRFFSITAFVATETTELSNGADAARTILELIEEGLTATGLTVGTDTMWIDLQNEQLTNVQLGRYVYAQTWRVTQLESHSIP